MLDEMDRELLEEQKYNRARQERMDKNKAMAWRIGLISGLLIVLIGMPIFGAARGCASKPSGPVHCTDQIEFFAKPELARRQECNSINHKMYVTLEQSADDKDKKVYVIRCICNRQLVDGGLSTD